MRVRYLLASLMLLSLVGSLCACVPAIDLRVAGLPGKDVRCMRPVAHPDDPAVPLPSVPPPCSCEQGMPLPEKALRPLLLMDEPSLCGARDGAVIRLVWIGSFHPPLMVRVTQRGGRRELVAARLPFQDGTIHDYNAEADHRVTRDVSQGEWNELVRVARSITPYQNDSGNDGVWWIVETNDGGTYGVREAWSPPVDSPIRVLARAMLALARSADEGAPVFVEDKR